MTSLCRQSLCASSSPACKAFSGACSTSSKAMPLRGSFMQQCRLSSSQLSSPLQPRNLSSTGGAVPQQQQQQPSSSPSTSSGASSVACHGFDPKGGKGGGSVAAGFNSAYLVIFGIFGGLMLLRNPYIFAALSIATILPQNSSVTSLNQLVIIFYESGLFMNFAEAVSCVRLVTWLSIICTLVSFAIFQ